MPFNSEFVVPIAAAIPEQVAAAPQGSLTLPIMGPSSLICAGKGGKPVFPVELTTFSAYLPDENFPDDEIGLVFKEPQIFVEPASSYPANDKAAWSPGDLMTNGDTIAIIAMTPENGLQRCLIKEGASGAPLMLFKGWHIRIDGQFLFTKLP